MSKRIFFKIFFYKDGTKKDGLRSSCKLCTNQNHYGNREKRTLRERNRRAKDVNFRLAHNIRVRTCQAFKSQNVENPNRTFD